MLTLSLLRHAKSSWKDADLSDIERRLNGRGRAAAPRMGRLMIEHDIQPDLVLCSAARRARETLKLVLPEFSGEPRVRWLEELYLAAPGQILSCVRAVGARHSSVLVVGHNPGMHSLALGLCDDGEREARADLARQFPTAALAVFSFDALSWAAVSQATGHLDLFATPRQLD